MALITCPECGKQISDKAEVCIGCGYPIGKELLNTQELSVSPSNPETVKAHIEIKELTLSMDEIYDQENGKKMLMVKRVKNETNLSLEESRQLVDEYWKKRFPEKILHYTPQGEIPEKEVKVIDVSNRYDKPQDNHKIKCPKCRSIEYQIFGTNKKFSLGKAFVGNVVGGLVLGPVGALAGTLNGVNGKNGKTKFVCNQCGHIWQQKV